MLDQQWFVLKPQKNRPRGTADRQTDRHTDRQAHTQTGTRTVRLTDRPTHETVAYGKSIVHFLFNID